MRGKRALEERISSSISSVEPASSTPARMTIARQPTCYTDTVSPSPIRAGKKESADLIRLRRGVSRCKTEMSHQEPSMSLMKYPAQCFGEVVGGVDDPGYVLENYVAECSPLLKSKVSNVDVARALCGA